MARTSNEAAEENTQPEGATVARKERKRLAALVLPPYSLKAVKTGDILAIRVDTEIVTKPDMEEDGVTQKLDKKKQPAFLHLVNVTDLDTGERGEMVLPFIIHKAFAEITPLAGKCFELVKGTAEANKATKWEVYEIEAE